MRCEQENHCQDYNVGKKTMIEESDIIKKIQKNNTKEKEILQALEKKMD